KDCSGRDGAKLLRNFVFRGGGAADFKPAIAEAEKWKPDLLIHLTDLDGDAGIEPLYWMKMSRSIMLSLAEARRLAVASQGFGLRPLSPSIGRLRKLAARLHAFQIDSVNVLARAHYVPAFARLGPYPMSALDSLAYSKRELFEYWGHAACLMPIALHPLLRHRMDRHADHAREYMRTERGAPMAKAYAEVA